MLGGGGGCWGKWGKEKRLELHQKGGKTSQKPLIWVSKSIFVERKNRSEGGGVDRKVSKCPINTPVEI